MKLGLTGSIGMGKSTVAKMFADFGVQVWDADRVVKSLYASDQGLFDLVNSLAPEAIENERIHFDNLRAAIKSDPNILSNLETYIHPKVRDDRADFLKHTKGAKLCDIPLLFENNMKNEFDNVIVVSAPFDVQLERVMDRNSMSRSDFDFILSRQIPDAEKRERADFVIDTGVPFEETRGQVQELLYDLGVLNA